MTTIENPSTVDADKLMAFVYRTVGQLGATLNAARVVMGDKLGLYRALAGAGPLTPSELAGTAGVSVRVRFSAVSATAFPGREYDLVTMFDCLHDMGDPVGAARRVRDSLTMGWPGGGRRTRRRRRRRGQPQPGGPRLLRVLDVAVHPVRAVPGRRTGVGCTSRRGPDPGRGHGRRFHPIPLRRGDAVQPGVRGKTVNHGPAGTETEEGRPHAGL